MNTVTAESKTDNSTRAIAQALLDKLYEGASQIVATGEEHAPFLFLQRKNGGGIEALLLDNFPKDVMASLHRAAALAPSVECAALVLEGWVHKSDKTNPKDAELLKALQAGQIRVSDLPDKGEAIIFNLRVGSEQFVSICHIDRAAKTLGKAPLFDPAGGDGKDLTATGRFIGTPGN
jgi:hypothetical protein